MDALAFSFFFPFFSLPVFFCGFFFGGGGFSQRKCLCRRLLTGSYFLIAKAQNNQDGKQGVRLVQLLSGLYVNGEVKWAIMKTVKLKHEKQCCYVRNKYNAARTSVSLQAALASSPGAWPPGRCLSFQLLTPTCT